MKAWTWQEIDIPIEERFDLSQALWSITMKISVCPRGDIVSLARPTTDDRNRIKRFPKTKTETGKTAYWGALMLVRPNAFARFLLKQRVAGFARLTTFCLVLAALLCARCAQAAPRGYTIYVVPHSHIDIEWYWTYDQTQVIAINILSHALRLLKEDPHYAFTQDQVEALKPFWESLSDADKEFLRRMIREGRFEVTTGTYVQPEIAEPDFESLTRQFLVARPWLEKTLRPEILTSWNIDTYGQTIQMPQFSREAGLRYFVFMRDVPPALVSSVKSPFYWKSPDGSKVLAYWLSGSYGTGAKSIADHLKVFVQHNAPGNDKIMIPWGEDLYLPDETSEQIRKRVLDAAKQDGIPVNSVIITIPSRYFKDVLDSGVSLPTRTNDFNPPFHIADLRGLYGESIEGKIAERRSEEALESSEKFNTIASFYGLPYPAQALRAAWQKVLFNQDHDIMPGSHTQAVEDKMMSWYRGAIDTAESTLGEALYHLSRKVDTSKSGDFPFLVFNALSYPRSEIVRYEPLFKEQIKNFQILDSNGHPVPFRMIAAKRWTAAGPLSMAAIEFIAKGVPSLGCRVYRIEPTPGLAQALKWQAVSGPISNRFFTLRIDPATGEISSLTDRRSGKEMLDTRRYQGNEVILEEEKDPDTEGMIHLTGREIRTGQIHPDSIQEITDALGTRVRIERPFLGGRLAQEVSLYNEAPRIDFKTSLLGFPGHDGMLESVFPLRNGGEMKNYYETNNTVTERPDGIFGAQTWVDLEDAGGGEAILNRGTGGYHIEHGIAKLILLRSITNYHGYYCPQAAQTGSHVFEYSLYPHQGGWGESGVVDEGHSLNSPLRVVATDAHAGELPPEFSFLSVPEGHFEVTALKKAEAGEGIILRGYETHNQMETVRMDLKLPVEEAETADLLEQPFKAKPIAIQKGRLELTCKPSEFITLRMHSTR